MPTPSAAGRAIRLVDEVDRLVGERTIGDISHAEVDRRVHGLVADLDVMVLLEPLRIPNRMATASSTVGSSTMTGWKRRSRRRVLLDVLAVLIEGRRADALELPAREWRLEDVRRVDRALGGAGADQRVELVDEEDAVRARRSSSMIFLSRSSNSPRYFAGDERPDVECEDSLVRQCLGNVAGHDAVRERLGDRGLADAGLADEGRVVLSPSREDLDDALDLLLAPDDRVEHAGPRGLRQVDAELIERRRLRGSLRLLRRRRAARLREDVDDLVAHLVEVDAEALEHAGGDPLLAHEPEEQVLGADVVVPGRRASSMASSMTASRGA